MEAAMRSEEEMMHLILQVAKDDERVRAVYLNGSRTNPNAPKDRFQDYDVVYVVTDTKPYYENHDWIISTGLLGKHLIFDGAYHETATDGYVDGTAGRSM